MECTLSGQTDLYRNTGNSLFIVYMLKKVNKISGNETVWFAGFCHQWVLPIMPEVLSGTLKQIGYSVQKKRET